jgi:hypothetical protein
MCFTLEPNRLHESFLQYKFERALEKWHKIQREGVKENLE